uniref:Uncharacterized protein n=1 Tax=Rangifer tarandus platyrhynchus TaxID=3082113 RepID=A0ACB0E4T1_RANTA|nr:unnamed protein product [Rangifer tarandus platyrhynchus]
MFGVCELGVLPAGLPRASTAWCRKEGMRLWPGAGPRLGGCPAGSREAACPGSGSPPSTCGPTRPEAGTTATGATPDVHPCHEASPLSWLGPCMGHRRGPPGGIRPGDRRLTREAVGKEGSAKRLSGLSHRDGASCRSMHGSVQEGLRARTSETQRPARERRARRARGAKQCC